MEKVLEFSLSDDVASKFCYDMDNRRIEIYFDHYFDVLKNESINESCVLNIEKWSDAKSKIHGSANFDSLDSHMGIFSMVLSMHVNNDVVELSVNTIDNRFVDFIFTKPQFELFNIK